MTTRPRLLIEDWLPAQAIGVECMRENSTGQHPPPNRLHVWWARRPLTVSRAAVLASLLPADFDRPTFERLLGFGRPAAELVHIRSLMDEGIRVPDGFGSGRAFSNALREPDLVLARQSIEGLWGPGPLVLDSMAGGGSIPFESARLGMDTLANEYNPVACSILEATLDYPFRFGTSLAERARCWGNVWEARVAERMESVYPREPLALVHAYIFARTVPCPDTGHPTPLVPDWSLLRKTGKPHLVAEPVITDREAGAWTIRVRRLGKAAGELRQPPRPTYQRGNGISLFSGAVIPGDYIKAMAQAGKMGSRLYAIAVKGPRGLDFRPPEPSDLDALRAAEAELARRRPAWEREGTIPTELYPEVSSDERPRLYGMPRWADMFAPRQLLALGALVEELRRLRPEILAAEGEDAGEAVVHLLALTIDKFTNHNCIMSKWECTRGVVKGKFDRHDFAFRPTYCEMAVCVAGSGLAWAIDNVLDAYAKLCALPRAAGSRPVLVTRGSAASLLHLDDGGVTAVVVDPPYADNVQYAELADFFYVWLKRTQGHRRPEWFSAYLCEKEREAVVNHSRFREADARPGQAKQRAHAFYAGLMAEIFAEARRVLRDDGVLTVMFTHKQQSAWAALFESLIGAGFSITATWPAQTESQHSLHQAQKNAAQSTVILAARKRQEGAGRGYFDDAMRGEMRQVARAAAARLRDEGLNPVDQLVGAFGPAMAVYSRYAEVRTDTGEPVGVELAIQTAADAVAEWRAEQLAQRGLDGIDPESRFVLLCWDVLGAAEFRFNEAMLLGRSVGMDVSRLVEAGLVEKASEKVRLLPAAARRRASALREPPQMSLLGDAGAGRGRKRSRRQIHPGDEGFASAIDMCHALALRYAEAGAGQAGIGAARGMALQQGWDAGSPAARLMEALVRAAPAGVRFPGKKGRPCAADAFPEFRAWHALLKPLFAMEPPAWSEPVELQPALMTLESAADEDQETDVEDVEGDEPDER